ncbi:hypothetical protein JPSP43_20830 [Staphylococcus pseudintermedius]
MHSISLYNYVVINTHTFLYLVNLIVSIIILGMMFGFLLYFESYKRVTTLLAYIPHYTFEL